jgi:hypothetical protein
MPRTNHKKLFSHFARNYKTKAPPIRAPAMTMTAERSGSRSTTAAPLDLEEEDVADSELEAALAEGLALEEEVDTGNGVSVKQFKKVGQKDDKDH